MKVVNSLLLLVTILCVPHAGGFIISTANRIQAKEEYEFYFSETAVLPDYTVKVSETTILPDLTLKIVHDPKTADLIFVDDYRKADMYVSKAKTSLGAKTIKVSETAVLPDLSVKLSETAILPDFTIYVLSTRFTKEEAAAMFAVIWQAANEKEETK